VRRTYPQLCVEIHFTPYAKIQPRSARGGVFHQSTTVITTTRVLILFLRTISCENCCACEKVLLTIAIATVPDILSRAYLHSVFRACGLYTFLKNEYSTLAV
jgi:hypothetical protein